LIVSISKEKGARVAPALAAVGGLFAWLAAYLLPLICRAVLARDPNWDLAAGVSIVAVSLIPGTLIAAIVPCELRSRLDECEGPRPAARIALRLMGIMTLGGVAGVLLTAKPLLRADEVDVWVHAYLTGGLLALCGLASLSHRFKAVVAVLLGALVGLSVVKPSEIQESQFAVALETAWKDGHGAGLYYRRTAHGDVLDEDALAKLRREAGTQKSGLIFTLEMLEGMGAVTIGGEGLLNTVNLALSMGSKPYILPFFRQVNSVRSDGEGMLHVEIKRKRGVDGVKFDIPGAEPGEKVEFWYKDDFTIRLIHTKNIWKLEFGPLTTERAGIFEFNDTYSTPVRCENVAAWIDASVLGIIIEDHADQVVVKAVAQGDIGDVKTVDVQLIPKEKKR
jgi:hypothetical protein